MEDTLKVADKVIKVESKRHQKGYDYTIATVKRLTPTRAVLDKKGIQVVNKKKEFWGDEVGFAEHGNSWDCWQRLTPELEAAAKKESELNKASNWWHDKYGRYRPSREEALRLKGILEGLEDDSITLTKRNLKMLLFAAYRTGKKTEQRQFKDWYKDNVNEDWQADLEPNQPE